MTDKQSYHVYSVSYTVPVTGEHFTKLFDTMKLAELEKNSVETLYDTHAIISAPIVWRI